MTSANICDIVRPNASPKDIKKVVKNSLVKVDYYYDLHTGVTVWNVSGFDSQNGFDYQGREFLGKTLREAHSTIREWESASCFCKKCLKCKRQAKRQ